MAKKADLLDEAKKLGLVVTEKNTVAEIEAVIKSAAISSDSPPVAELDETFAKSGKRSKVGQEETEAKIEKIAKQHGDLETEEIEPKKGPTPKVRSRLERRSKKYQQAAALIEPGKSYSLPQAAELLPKTSTTNFVASLELHVNLGVDPKHADQNIRLNIALAHGTGKTVRVAVFAPSELHAAAKKAGADIVGEDEFLQLLDKQQLDFDVLISTPKLMAKLGKYARVLGPKGLMPNPKSGTVTDDVATAVTESKAGKVEIRVDKQGIIHQAVGKTNFTPQQIVENTQAVLKAIKEARPASLKGNYILKVSMSTTMGPSLSIDKSNY